MQMDGKIYLACCSRLQLFVNLGPRDIHTSRGVERTRWQTLLVTRQTVFDPNRD